MQKKDEKLVYETANLTNEDTNKTENASLSGVSEERLKTINSNFETPENVTGLDKEASSGLSNLKNLTSQENIISKNTMKEINKQFQMPAAVTEADAYLSQQLKQIQSGKTSYSDEVQAMMDKIVNRDKFSYDVDSDPLFQQALASAMNSGKQAMQNTIGQASALTGGYGSSYATTAGNQAYNAFIEDAYNNLPQYYQMAMEAYQMEGDEMYRQLGMYNDADAKEYERMVTAYDATYQHRNQIYNEAYGQFRDSKSDAFASANLQLNEHGQRVNDAYNYYSAVSNEANTMYDRAYSSWQDQVNTALQMAQLENSDYWSKTTFDENVREYEKNYARDVFESDRAYEQTEKWNQANMDFQASEAEKNRTWQSSEADKDRAFTASENAKNRSAKVSKDSGSGDGYYASDKQKQAALDAYINGGTEALIEYVDSQKGGMNTSELMSYIESNVVPSGTTIKKTKNTMNGFLGIGGITGHIDSNDEYEITYPGEKPVKVKAKDLPESIRSRVDNLKEGKSITW